MTPEHVERVFGRGRLKMVTGEHVEVFREAVAPGERRRYTKRFLSTGDADFGQWTEREWRILARLIGHGIRCVPDVVQFDRGAMGGMRQVQTYDAGITVDQWATLLPVSRNGVAYRHVFEDCAHWWALAHHCLAALDEIHALQLVHLDIKGDNICIPYGPANFDPEAPGARFHPIFPRLALIDFAFSLVSRESLATPLPIGWQKDYDYQSPRLLCALEAGRAGDLQPTRELDWRCDLYSLAAMLKRYLPDEDRAQSDGAAAGWTIERYYDAKALIFRIRDRHDRDFPHWRPHQELIDFTGARLRDADLAASLDYGWTLARDASVERTAASPITPMTRIAPSIRASDASRLVTRIVVPTAVTAIAAPAAIAKRRRRGHAVPLLAALVALAAFAAPSFVGDPVHPLADRAAAAYDALRTLVAAARHVAPPEPPAPDRHVASHGAPAEAASAEAAPAEAAPGEPPRAQPSSPEAAPATSAADAPAPASSEPPSSVEPLAAAQAAAPDARRDSSRAPRTKESASARQKAPVNAARSDASPRASAAPPRGAARPPHRPQRAVTNAVASKAPQSRSSTSIASAQSASRSAKIAASPRESAPPINVAAASTPPRDAAPAPADVPSTPPAAPPASERVQPVPGATPSVPADASRAPNAAPGDASRPSNGAPPDASRPSNAAPPDERRAPGEVPYRAPQARTAAPPRDDLRSQLSALWRTLRGREQRAAPVEERRALAAAPAPRAPEPATAPSDRLPLAEARAAEAPRAPAAIEEPRAQPGPSWYPAPRASPPAVRSPDPFPADDGREDLATQGRRLLADAVPRVAAQAQSDVTRVMWMAANAYHPSQESAIVDAVHATWRSEGVSIATTSFAPAYARRLHDEARRAFATTRRASDAADLEFRAFAANPRDPDVASYLAFLQLKATPARPEVARELALHAIAVSGSRRTARADDWNTLAIASALTGRDADARHAMFVAIALARNVERSCRTALSAYASFGERLRVPVEAALYRIHSQGRGFESPYCAWPPNWSAAARSP